MSGRNIYRSLKRRLKDRLVSLAYRHLGVNVGELDHPLALIEQTGLPCRGLIHVGANLGQEFESYRRAGLASVVYIEPIPEIFAALQARVSVDPRHRAIQALCAERDGDEVAFHLASNDGASSSLLEPGWALDAHPDVRFTQKLTLRTTTLDRVVFGTPGLDPNLFDCLVMDVQGAEMKVVAGAERTLAQCRFVFTEINEGGLYRGDTPYDELIAALKRHGFALKALGINRYRWGNAFLVKEPAR